MSQWADLTDANTYLTNKPGTAAWFASGFDGTVYVSYAYTVINNDPDYTFPDSPSAAQLTKLQGAQIEYAYFIFKNPNSERRQNLRAQGVKSFSVSKFSETFSDSKGYDFEGYSKYPVIVADFLRDFLATPSFSTTVTREQEDII
jgi:hypothetical protein